MQKILLVLFTLVMPLKAFADSNCLFQALIGADWFGVNADLTSLDQPDNTGAILQLISDDRENYGTFSEIQPRFIECGYVAHIQSLIANSVVYPSYELFEARGSDVDAPQYTSAYLVKFEPHLESETTPPYFLAISQFLLDNRLFRSVGLNALMEAYSENQINEGVFEARYDFWKVGENCPINWEVASDFAWTKNTTQTMNFGSERFELELQKMDISRNFVDQYPELVFAPERTDKNCALAFVYAVK